MTFEEIEKNETIRAYISKADESLVALGYTEHSFAHVTHVAAMAGYLKRSATTPTPSSWRRSRAICTTSAIWSTASNTRRAAPSWRSRS